MLVYNGWNRSLSEGRGLSIPPSIKARFVFCGRETSIIQRRKSQLTLVVGAIHARFFTVPVRHVLNIRTRPVVIRAGPPVSPD